MSDDNPAPDERTLALVYDLFKDILHRQMEAVNALDTKAIQTIAAATAAAAVSALGSRADLCPEIMGVALALYIGVVIASVWALWPRSWALLHGARSIWNTVWSYQPAEYHHSMIERISDDAAYNRDLIASKARALRTALIIAAFEIATVVVAVLEASLR